MTGGAVCANRKGYAVNDSLLLRRVRVVGAADDAMRDVRIANGTVVSVEPSIAPQLKDRVIDAEGRWMIPGLWDQHVHMRQWAEASSRLDLSATRSAREVLDLVANHIRQQEQNVNGASGRSNVIVGAGFRVSDWPDQASVRDLDAVSGDFAVALISGDGHCGWLNSQALQFYGRQGQETLLDENEWFELYARLGELTQREHELGELYRRAISEAHSLGIVGITDLEYAPNYETWPRLVADNVGTLRVRAGFYPDRLDEVLSKGLRTGDQLAPFVTLGSLKIIADGSLGTLTAYCCEPYSEDPNFPRGKKNYSQQELLEMLATASANGLHVAFHAIGDAAIHDALDAFAATGAQGTIEHAQLIQHADVERMASLGLGASVQPTHLIDDLSIASRVWSDRADRCFLFGSMVKRGVRLLLGSDAPVSPLNPWLAMDAAVNRRAASGTVWNAEERISSSEALFASTDGQGPIAEGSRGDVVLLDDDPMTAPLAGILAALTVIDGEPVFDRT